MTGEADGHEVGPEVRVEVRGDPAAGVATVTLCRPDALNALTPNMLDLLDERLSAIAADPDVRVVVLTGAGRAFSAGVDLKVLGGMSLTGGAVGEAIDIPARAVIGRLTTMPQIVVARVHGHCYTGALELVLACDLVVTAGDARFADTHAKWGLRPSWGMSQRLIRTVGVTRARELSYTGRTFTGAEAAGWGLAVRAVPVDGLDAAVSELVAGLVTNSAASLAAYKDLYRAALDHGLAAGLGYESGMSYPIPDTAERLAVFR